MSSSWLSTALAALDLGRVTGAFVDWLAGLRVLGLERLYLLHVIPVELVEHVAAGYPVTRLEEELARRALEELQAHAETLRRAGVEVVVLEPPLGVPGQVIAEEARRLGVGFVALASRGGGLLRRILVGSTVEETVNNADKPVLVARVVGGEPRLAPLRPGSTVLAGVARDEYAGEVARRAGDVAARLGARLVLAHVMEEGERDEEAHSLLDSLEREATASGASVERVIVAGHPGRELLELARRYEASLVVVGRASSRRRGLGSTAEVVIRRSRANVLVCA